MYKILASNLFIKSLLTGTYDFVGRKSVHLKTTGKEKVRATCVLTCFRDGTRKVDDNFWRTGVSTDWKLWQCVCHHLAERLNGREGDASLLRQGECQIISGYDVKTKSSQGSE